jgi:hypothetical protein
MNGLKYRYYEIEPRWVFCAYYKSGSGIVKEEINILCRPKWGLLIGIKAGKQTFGYKN